MAFKGIQQYAADPKGRVPVSPEHRDELQGDLVCTFGWDPCILIFTAERFAELEEKLVDKADILDPTPHDVLRQFIGHRAVVQLDRQYRITLPKAHRQRAGISTNEDENQVLMIGMVGWVECWSKSVYEEYSRTRWTRERIQEQAQDVGIAPPSRSAEEREAADE